LKPLLRDLVVPKLPGGPKHFVLLDWYCDEGDQVAAGDLVADMVSTDGVLLIEMPAGGQVHTLAAGPGETLEAGETLLTLTVNPHAA